MITEAQKQKMLECVIATNFCDYIGCKDCPLWKGEHDCNCLRSDLFNVVDKIKITPTCPHCKQEMKELQEAYDIAMLEISRLRGLLYQKEENKNE